MMRWLADAAPRLKIIETWNNVDNSFMINVNEALGYRLSSIFNMYKLRLETRHAPPPLCQCRNTWEITARPMTSK
jgi:hypothetical protein